MGSAVLTADPGFGGECSLFRIFYFLKGVERTDKEVSEHRSERT